MRLGLECNAAALAAQRADETDITALEQSIDEMQHEVTFRTAGHRSRYRFSHGHCLCRQKSAAHPDHAQFL
ncbi:MAG: FCD domain-containing protein [Desulfotignum sp.]|nr:FCD domain-containing protein [Desulfotignum sp.]